MHQAHPPPDEEVARARLLAAVRAELRKLVRQTSVNGAAQKLRLSRHVVLTLTSSEAEPRDGSLYLAAERLGISLPCQSGER